MKDSLSCLYRGALDLVRAGGAPERGGVNGKVGKVG
jgi:hypothetical protein